MEPETPGTWYHVWIVLDNPEDWIKPVTVVRETELYVYVDEGSRRPRQMMKVSESSRAAEAFFPTKEEAVKHVLRSLAAQAEGFATRHKQAQDRYKMAVAHFGSPA